LRSRSVQDDQWRILCEDGCLPGEAFLLRWIGSSVWLAGEGYIAVFDLDRQKLRSICRVPSRSVDQIQVGMGSMWAQFGQQLYRVSLSDIH
jgi:hypothetical protein